MDTEQFLEEFYKRVSEARTNCALKPGYNTWEFGYVTGLERALKIAIAVYEEDKNQPKQL